MLDQSQVTINLSWLVMISQMVNQSQVMVNIMIGQGSLGWIGQ